MAANANGLALPSEELIERVVALGDIEGLKPIERARYYVTVCESMGLNPNTQPLAYIRLQGKLTLYAKRDATDQLRKRYAVSVVISGRERIEDLYIVTARATTPDGRCDESTGAVSLAGLKGENLANALMKAETKAKRRVTLSICGLGFLDESEVADVRGARPVTVTADGEVIESKPEPQDLTKQLAASIDWVQWASQHALALAEANTKGALMEAWANVQADVKKLNPPAEQVDALRVVKDAEKERFS